MEECMVESETLGVMIILIRLKVDVQKPKKLTVKQWGDDEETISDMKYQDRDSFVQVPIGIGQIIACMMIIRAVLILINHCRH